MLHARFNGPPLVAAPVLLVVCSYRGGIGRTAPLSIAATFPALRVAGRILDYLALLPLRRFVAQNRDFFANPRDLRYQAGLARELLTSQTQSEVVCAVDAAYKDMPAIAEFDGLGRVEVRAADELGRDAERFATVALIYPDPLGLGWSHLEGRLRRSPARNIVFVNGRRRVMTLDSSAQRALNWRRLLAKTRVVELLWACVLVPIAATYAAIDALRGRQ